MSTDLSKTKGIDNTSRRKWDVDFFQKIAEERKEKQLEEELEKQKDALARSMMVGQKTPKALLKQREYDPQVEKNLLKRMVVTETTPLQQQGGWWCDVCECALKDSTSWLDHINGRRHQKKLGMSMRVEQSSVNQVQAKIQQMKRKREDEALVADLPIEYDFETRINNQATPEDTLEARREKRRRAKERKKAEEEEIAKAAEDEMDDEEKEMRALMGM